MDFAEARQPTGAHLAVDPAVGNIRRLVLVDGARQIEPLHVAPWVDDPAVAADEAVPPVERTLAGDFLCMPFGASDLDPSPPHGWTANSPWRVDAADPELRLTLERRVHGATVEKRLSLAPDAPLLYQEHVVSGGEGGVTLAHHPMLRLAGRGRLSTSPKRAALTPDRPLEPGRHILACPARSADLTAFPGADGGTVDLTRLPIADRHEDFVTLVDADDSPLGWTAVVREAEDDVVFVLKNPAVLPVTMLWHSNGGRDYSPWNGRHRGVIGIEDGRAAGAAGHRAALGPNAVAAEGVPTAFTLAPGATHRIAHVIGAIARPAEWEAVTAIAAIGDRLVITGDGGAPRALPFRAGFFASASEQEG